jgi:hypothetical protein
MLSTNPGLYPLPRNPCRHRSVWALRRIGFDGPGRVGSSIIVTTHCDIPRSARQSLYLASRCPAAYHLVMRAGPYHVMLFLFVALEFLSYPNAPLRDRSLPWTFLPKVPRRNTFAFCRDAPSPGRSDWGDRRFRAAIDAKPDRRSSRALAGCWIRCLPGNNHRDSMAIADGSES